jgi:hypothetical protein
VSWLLELRDWTLRWPFDAALFVALIFCNGIIAWVALRQVGAASAKEQK